MAAGGVPLVPRVDWQQLTGLGPHKWVEVSRTVGPELWMPCWMVTACQFSAAVHVVRMQEAAKASGGTVNS